MVQQVGGVHEHLDNLKSPTTTDDGSTLRKVAQENV